jgi:hypothetical protein
MNLYSEGGELYSNKKPYKICVKSISYYLITSLQNRPYLSEKTFTDEKVLKKDNPKSTQNSQSDLANKPHYNLS